MSARLFGVDFGRSRVGVAAADDLGLLAHPRATLDVKGRDPAKVTAEFLLAENARAVVVGLPLTLDGAEGRAAAAVRSFADSLRRRCPHLDVILHDERLTTVSAADALRSSGRRASKSRHLIDQAAACEILQSHLDTIALQNQPPHGEGSPPTHPPRHHTPP